MGAPIVAPSGAPAAIAAAATNQRLLATEPLPSSGRFVAGRSRSRLSPRKERNGNARRQQIFLSSCKDNFLTASDIGKQNRFLEQLRLAGLPVERSEKSGFSALVRTLARF
jgi:hypothetical protein